MILAGRTAAQLVVSDRIKVGVHGKAERIKCLVVMEVHILINFLKADSTDAAHCVCKIFVDYILADSDCFENLRGLIGLNR